MKFVLYGFILIAAILQIIYVPLIMLHVSFNIVYYTSIMSVVILLICYVILLRKFINKKRVVKVKRKIEKKEIIITILLVIMIIAQAITSNVLFNENADDAFYVSLMEQSKDFDSIYTVDPSTGLENTSSLNKYMVSGYELSISVLSKLTTISTVTLAHTIIPFFMIIFSYIAYYEFARKFFNREKSKTFLLMLSILFLFSGFLSRYRGLILLSRMWQGKEIFLNIILTLILANLISLNKYNEKRNLILLTVLNFAAVFFTNTAIFLVPFAYMAFGIIELIKRNWKMFIKLILTGIPIMIYAVLYLINSNTSNVLISDVNVIDIIKEYMGLSYYYILYIISLIIIAIKGTKRAKKYFIAVPIIYVLTIYNPLFTNIIAKYFTGSEVFWRLLWLLPVEFSIVYSFIIILNSKKVIIFQIPVFIIEIMLLVLAGKFVYTADNGFRKAENQYKIPQAIVNNTQYILENSDKNTTQMIIAPPEPLHSTTMRQYTSKLNLLWSRDMYMKEILSEKQYEERNILQGIQNGQIIQQVTPEEYDTLREKYNVN